MVSAAAAALPSPNMLCAAEPILAAADEKPPDSDKDVPADFDQYEDDIPF